MSVEPKNTIVSMIFSIPLPFYPVYPYIIRFLPLLNPYTTVAHPEPYTGGVGYPNASNSTKIAWSSRCMDGDPLSKARSSAHGMMRCQPFWVSWFDNLRVLDGVQGCKGLGQRVWGGRWS